MKSRPPDRARRLAALAVAVVGTLLGLVLRQPGWRLGDVVRQQSYDTLHALAGGVEAVVENPQVVLVYLDLHSFLTERLDPGRPWPRSLHAQLLRRLVADGARAVVFDVVFGGAGADPAADTAVAEAIRACERAGVRVILAGQANDDSGQSTRADAPWVRLFRVERPHPPFREAAAGWGLANHVVDEDFVVRRIFAGFTSPPQPSLAWCAAERLGLAVTRGADAMREANGKWIRYYGPPLTLPHVSVVQALQPSGVPEGFFRDRTVFIGARPMAEGFLGRQDEFRSPFHSWRNSELFLPGVEVHATEFLNLLRGDGLRRLPGTTEWLVLAGVAWVSAGLMWLRPLPAAGAALGGAVLAAGVARMGFAAGIWFPWGLVSVVQLPAALVGSWLFHFQEWQTTRRAMEAARRAAEARIREQAALIDKATDAILVRGLDGGVLFANPGAERLYGWSVEDLRGGAAGRIEADPERVREAREAVLERGEWSGDLAQRNRQGSALMVESRWTLIRDEQGAPRSLLVINSDVTGRRQLERESLRLQRTEAIGALASGMAHDLNNALAPVLMGVQLLRREAADDEARRVLDLMESSTLRGAGMVRQVVLFARGRSEGLEPVDLRPLVKEMEQLVRDTFPKSIVVTTHLPADLWLVRGNPTELHQVLLNLCVNARDAMPAAGRLDLILDNLDVPVAGDHEGAPGSGGGWVSLLVSDSGAGIPPEILERIFDPFFTTKPEGRGTGLGLSTTARIIKAHGGSIRVESRPGEGTTFEVLLPRLVAVAPAAAEGPGELEPRGGGERVLVVDDDRAVRELLGRTLVDHGYRTVVAGDGAEALAVFRKQPSEIALVICDRSMPVMDGDQAFTAIRAIRPAVRWLWMSAEEVPVDGAGGRGGRIGWLSKPFTVPLLLQRLRDLLDGPADESPG